jgi:hypothetical protein
VRLCPSVKWRVYFTLWSGAYASLGRVVPLRPSVKWRVSVPCEMARLFLPEVLHMHLCAERCLSVPLWSGASVSPWSGAYASLCWAVPFRPSVKWRVCFSLKWCICIPVLSGASPSLCEVARQCPLWNGASVSPWSAAYASLCWVVPFRPSVKWRVCFSLKWCTCIAMLRCASPSFCEVARPCPLWGGTSVSPWSGAYESLCWVVHLRPSVKWRVRVPCEVGRLFLPEVVHMNRCAEWCVSVPLWSGASGSPCEVGYLYRCMTRIPLHPFTSCVAKTPASSPGISWESGISYRLKNGLRKNHFILIRGTESAWIRPYLEIGFSWSQYLLHV